VEKQRANAKTTKTNADRNTDREKNIDSGRKFAKQATQGRKARG
jgi:hypothetical protein